jgi:acyl carrier protein
MLPYAAKSRFALVLHGADAAEDIKDSGDIHARLAGKTPNEITEIVRGLMLEEVGRILLLGVERIDPGRTLQSLGMDSLMTVELAAGLEQRFGIRLPAMMLQDAPTIDKVAARITAQLADGEYAAEDTSTAGNVMEMALKHGEEILDNDAAAIVAEARSKAYVAKREAS